RFRGRGGFFFQAEDGIRDFHVTRVQTCALPILALNMEIATNTYFDRKHYFYPDNPKAYQISQDEQPIGRNGWIEIEINGEKKRKIGRASCREREEIKRAG